MWADREETPYFFVRKLEWNSFNSKKYCLIPKKICTLSKYKKSTHFFAGQCWVNTCSNPVLSEPTGYLEQLVKSCHAYTKLQSFIIKKDLTPSKNNI